MRKAKIMPKKGAKKPVIMVDPPAEPAVAQLLPADNVKEKTAVVHAASATPARSTHFTHYVDASKEEIEGRMAVARYYINSGLIPKALDRPEKVLIIMALAQALDVPIMHALNSMYVVNGKPAMQADIMRALIFRSYPDATFIIKENTAEKCTISAGRPGQKPQEFSFTMDEAKQAGLLAKQGPWHQYPKAMLLARASSIAARVLFPDVLMGVIYTPEELGASVNEDGEVIDLTPLPVSEASPSYKEPAPPPKPAAQAPSQKPKSSANSTRASIIAILNGENTDEGKAGPESADKGEFTGHLEYSPKPNSKEIPYSIEQHKLMCKLVKSHLIPTVMVEKIEANIKDGTMSKEMAKKGIDYLTKTIEMMGYVESLVRETFEVDGIKSRYIMLTMKNWDRERLNNIIKSKKFTDADLDEIGGLFKEE